MKRRRTPFLLCLILLLILPLALIGWTVHRQVRQSVLDRALIAAVKKEDVSAVKVLLAEGADANSRDKPAPRLSLWQLFLDGLRRHQLPAADVSQYPTALLLATEDNEGDKVKAAIIFALLDKGAQVNVADENGWTPLMRVEFWHNYRLFQALADKGADVNATDKNGVSALFFACVESRAAELKILLRHGAKVPARFDTGEVPVLTAIDEKGSRAVRLLVEVGADHHSTSKGATVMTESALLGNLELVRFWLDKGHCVNERDLDGRTPLMWAAVNERLPVLKFLIAQGADVTMKDTDGKTALFHAIGRKNLSPTPEQKEIVRLLKAAEARQKRY